MSHKFEKRCEVWQSENRAGSVLALVTKRIAAITPPRALVVLRFLLNTTEETDRVWPNPTTPCYLTNYSRSAETGEIFGIESARRSLHHCGRVAMSALMFMAVPVAGEGREGPEEDSHAVIQAFRADQLADDYSLFFTLKHMPRRGPTIDYSGQLWGRWFPGGTILLLRFQRALQMGDYKRTLLVLSGSEPRAWIGEDEGAMSELEGASLFEPIFPGIVYSPFELQMPFVYWGRYTVEGRRMLKGRHVHTFTMYPPPSLELGYADLGSVRIDVDEKFKALLKAQTLDRAGQPLKTFKILSFKRIDNQAIIKRIDLLNERTRDKTRFSVNAAALGLKLPANYFEANSADRDWDVVPLGEFHYFP